jgi:exopolysaccharide biosynthesis polyprenyl glycosylphosphotransferase
MEHAVARVGVSETSLPSAPRIRVAKRPGRSQPLIYGAPLVACLDSLGAIVAIVLVLIFASLPLIPAGAESFLSARVTVKNVLLLIFLATAWPLIFHLFGLYDARRVRRLGSEVGRLAAATTAGSALALAFPVTSVSGTMTVWSLPYFWLASFGVGLLLRASRRGVERVRHRQPRQALVIGTGPLARRAYEDIRAHTSCRYEVIGFLDDATYRPPAGYGLPQETSGTLDQLEHLLMRHVVDEVFIALPMKSCYQQIQSVISVCERAGVQAKYAAELFASTVAYPKYDAAGARVLVAMHVAPGGYRLIIKRAIDLVGAAVGLVILAPLLSVVALAIKLTSSGPVLFAQTRCGRNRRPFRMLKFRSMYENSEQLQPSLEDRNEATGPVFKIRDDPRITPLGRFLRKSSIDELPQLWNVLRGDMSLVGPRPLPYRDVQRITRPSDMRRFSMRPGITCLWQVQGRSNIGFDQWVELDLEYIDNWSLALDVRILGRTVPAVLSGDGAT